jgi:hypothetical protein
MRSRIVRSHSLLLFVGALLLLPPRMAAQSPAGTREKQVFVTVLDKSGAALKGLSPGDVVVREDGVARAVTAVERATDPMWLAMLVDTTREPQGTDSTTQDLRKALTAFVSALQATSEDTAMSLTQYAGAAVTAVNFTSKTEDLLSAIRHIAGSPQSGAVLLEALIDAGRRLSRAPSPRRVIVSVDFDNSAEPSAVLPSKVIESVHAAGASLWAISIRRIGADLGTPDTRQAVLSRLPDLTGGQHLRAIGTSSLESILLRLADVLTHQYLVTYIRPDAKPVSSITASSPRGAKTLITPWVR